MKMQENANELNTNNGRRKISYLRKMWNIQLHEKFM